MKNISWKNIGKLSRLLLVENQRNIWLMPCVVAVILALTGFLLNTDDLEGCVRTVDSAMFGVSFYFSATFIRPSKKRPKASDCQKTVKKEIYSLPSRYGTSCCVGCGRIRTRGSCNTHGSVFYCGRNHIFTIAKKMEVCLSGSIAFMYGCILFSVGSH